MSTQGHGCVAARSVTEVEVCRPIKEYGQVDLIDLHRWMRLAILDRLYRRDDGGTPPGLVSKLPKLLTLIQVWKSIMNSAAH